MNTSVRHCRLIECMLDAPTVVGMRALACESSMSVRTVQPVRALVADRHTIKLLAGGDSTALCR